MSAPARSTRTLTLLRDSRAETAPSAIRDAGKRTARRLITAGR